MTWEVGLIKYMAEKGWKLNRNDADKISFVFYQNEQYEWFREYDKKTKHFVQFNGKQEINLRCKNDN